jgi:hypothetical protein
MSARNDVGYQVGAFYYGWYGKYRHWVDNGHDPPRNWAADNIPNLYGSGATNATNLYDSQSVDTIKKQMEIMTDIGVQFGIASWWGQNEFEDHQFNKCINCVHPVLDDNGNPPSGTRYTNFKWCVMHEREGFGTPTVAQLVSDLNWIKTRYANSPYYLWKNGKPVIFVYNAAHDGYDPLNDLSRWEQARSQVPFYVVMKRDPLSAGAAANRMDWWFEYAPADAHYSPLTHNSVNYSAFVSPGFKLFHNTRRLAVATPAQFNTACTSLKSFQTANPNAFVTIQTLNEWGESTGVEPARAVVSHDDGLVGGFTLSAAPAEADQYHKIFKTHFGT